LCINNHQLGSTVRLAATAAAAATAGYHNLAIPQLNHVYKTYLVFIFDMLTFQTPTWHYSPVGQRQQRVLLRVLQHGGRHLQQQGLAPGQKQQGLGSQL
jgi:hypothetical protein